VPPVSFRLPQWRKQTKSTGERQHHGRGLCRTLETTDRGPGPDLLRAERRVGGEAGDRAGHDHGGDVLHRDVTGGRRLQPKNYAGTSPITRASGKKKAVLARFVHNDRLVDALISQAFSTLQASPGARGYYDQQRARGAGHNAALRQLANRLVGILHGCLKTRTLYDEATAWSHHHADHTGQETIAA
jgi:hypothetical protein